MFELCNNFSLKTGLSGQDQYFVQCVENDHSDIQQFQTKLLEYLHTFFAYTEKTVSDMSSLQDTNTQ